jgi:hypothetical protein
MQRLNEKKGPIKSHWQNFDTWTNPTRRKTWMKGTFSHLQGLCHRQVVLKTEEIRHSCRAIHGIETVLDVRTRNPKLVITVQ